MKKVSVIIPCYGTEKYIEKCIDSIFNQSYKNLEIIAVNDCSKGNMLELLKKKSTEDKRLTIIDNKHNKGLLQTRIIGSQAATGDYVSFIDSDDFIDADYFRLLVKKAEEDKCDIVLGNYVKKSAGQETISGLSFYTNNATFESKDYYERYYKQTGKDIRNHMLCSKLIDINVWKKTLNEVTKLKDKIIMTEDFAFSSVALFYSSKVGFCDNAIYYYVENETQSTNRNLINIEKINKNIYDIITVFDFIKRFLKEKKIYGSYKKYLKIWRAYYLSMHIELYEQLKEENENIPNLEFDYKNDKGIKLFKKISKADMSWNNYYNLRINYDERLNDIKKKIMDKNIKVVSFDMFDTLITRPFYTPSDMFKLLNRDFIKIFNSIKAIDFSRIRVQCESDLREINYKKNIPEVTLDGIYELISKRYNLDKRLLEIIKKKEIELEYHFCRKRKSGFELYELAKFVGKKVILTSDIYLPKNVLLKILKNNGYEFDEVYISSELLKTKANGNLFQYIVEKEKTTEIIHIGDNYHSDYKKPLEYNLKSAILYRAMDVFMGRTEKKVRFCGDLYRHFVSFNHDHRPYLESYGVRCSIAIAANYYFDNPFCSFNDYSDFNGDPYFIGYYALGMQNLALCNWLLEDAKECKIDSISFMARDGYLPYKSSTLIKEKIEKYNGIKLNYIYVSRKSLMPLLLRDKSGISMLETYLDYLKLTPKDILKQLNCVLKFDSKIEKELRSIIKMNRKFKTKKEFNDALSIIYDKCFDNNKYDNYYKMCKDYFNLNFTGNASTFDVGYSGKPEAIISSVIKKPVTTYFVHTNNSTGFNNINNCNSILKTFYDYKPTLSGTIREIFISNTNSSCISYKYQNNQVVPVFSEKEKYNFFNLDMIQKIQNGALDFLRTFLDYFGEFMSQIDLNKYYMSIPFEYYCHYAQREDRLPTNNFLFEDNVNNYVEINEYMFDMLTNYSKEFSLGFMPKRIDESEVVIEEKKDNINYNLPRSRIKRILFYSLIDKNELKAKWKLWSDKKNDQLLLPSSRFKRVIYYMIFDRKTLKKKIFKK